MTDYFERSLILHEQLRGKISVQNKLPIGSREDLSLAYTPGVARPCEVIAKDPEQARKLVQQKVGLLWAKGPDRGGGPTIGAAPHGLTVIGQ